MENLTIEEEWLEPVLEAKINAHHKRALWDSKVFRQKSPEEMLKLRKREGRQDI